MDAVAQGKLIRGLEKLYNEPLMVVGKGYDKKKVLSGAPDGAREETQILRLWLTQYVCENKNVEFKKKLAKEYSAEYMANFSLFLRRENGDGKLIYRAGADIFTAF